MVRTGLRAPGHGLDARALFRLAARGRIAEGNARKGSAPLLADFRIGPADTGKYVALAVFYALVHSLLEEYYWRWFVFGQLRALVAPTLAIVLSSLAFAAHHVILLYVYLPGYVLTAVVPFAPGDRRGRSILDLAVPEDRNAPGTMAQPSARRCRDLHRGLGPVAADRLMAMGHMQITPHGGARDSALHDGPNKGLLLWVFGNCPAGHASCKEDRALKLEAPMSTLQARQASSSSAAAVQTNIPARLDRLPWGRFHWLLVLALGVTWVLDGLEATIVAALSPVLRDPAALGLSERQMGLAGTVYLAGAITGAIVFGHLTDRLGRKRLFSVTLGIYLAGAVLTALAWDLWSFLLFRCITGMAIGGEYSAINSAIDELIPARVRGRVDLAVNGSYWLGAILGAGATVILLNPRYFPEWLGWRFSFGLGGLIGAGMLIARRYVPESPRWLLTHGKHDEAEEVMKSIESSFDLSKLPPATKVLTVHPGTDAGFGAIARTLLVRYRSRAVLGLVLIAAQAFFYNGLSFSFPLVLCNDFGVPAQHTGLYVMVISAANLLGPVLLGHFFDSIGRRKMISAAYGISALIVVVTQIFFLQGVLTAQSQTVLWALTFFLRLGSGQRRLPDRKRGLSPGNARPGDRLLLCDRHGHRRPLGTDPVWLPDRSRPARPAGERLFARRRAHAGRGGNGMAAWHRRREKIARGHCLPACRRANAAVLRAPFRQGPDRCLCCLALLALSVITLQARHTICTESFACLRIIRETVAV